MQVNSIQAIPNNQPAFKAHVPKSFPAMMTKLYNDSNKIAGDSFELSSIVRVSTRLKNGKLISGVVNFYNGKYAGLQMDEGCERYKQQLIQTVLEKYKRAITKGNIRKKLGY